MCVSVTVGRGGLDRGALSLLSDYYWLMVLLVLSAAQNDAAFAVRSSHTQTHNRVTMKARAPKRNAILSRLIFGAQIEWKFRGSSSPRYNNNNNL